LIILAYHMIIDRPASHHYVDTQAGYTPRLPRPHRERIEAVPYVLGWPGQWDDAPPGTSWRLGRSNWLLSAADHGPGL